MIVEFTTEQKEFILKKWLPALRSGKYMKGNGYMRRGFDTYMKWCCLGVVSDQAECNGCGKKGPIWNEVPDIADEKYVALPPGWVHGEEWFEVDCEPWNVLDENVTVCPDCIEKYPNIKVFRVGREVEKGDVILRYEESREKSDG